MRYLLFAVVTLSSFCALQAQEKSELIKQQIVAVRTRSNLAIRNHDVLGIMQTLTDDVNVTASNQQLFTGAEAFRKAWVDLFDQDQDLYFVRVTKEILLNEDGNSAWEQGTWTALRSKTSNWESYGGNYSALWVKEERKWKIKSQLFVKLY